MHSLGSLQVLRGSNIKGSSLPEAVDAVRTASEQLQKAQDQLDIARGAIKEVESASMSFLDHGDLANASHAELLEVIATLNSRVKQMTTETKKAEEERNKSRKDLEQTLKGLACGGFAGAVSRTAVSPIDRVKILMQTQALTQARAAGALGGEAAAAAAAAGAAAPAAAQPEKYRGIVQTLRLIFVEEGFTKLWRGNLTNVVRVIPYSATQFASYDFYKRLIYPKDRPINTIERLSAGALAGTTATTITHPLDVIRLRLNVQKELKGAADAFGEIWSEGGLRACFKGYVPTVLSLSPFIAINFATFDTLKSWYSSDGKKRGHLANLGLGAAAGLFAQSICYPLDTVRRRMQIKGKNYNSTLDAFRTITKKEGLKGFYKGMLPNAVKVVPNNSIRFVAYEWARKWMGVESKGEGGGGGG